MALTTELLSVLNNSEEPLTKRLCIAGNAFKSFQFPVINKESLLLDWFNDLGSQLDDADIWINLHGCLTSKRLRLLKQDEIRQDALTNIIKTVTNRLKDDLSEDLKLSILRCAVAILRDNIFQQYFTHDIKRYCLLVASILNNINSLNELIDVTCGKSLYNKYIINHSDYRKYFLVYLFDAVIHVLTKFEDPKLLNGCKQLVEQAIFPSTSKDYISQLTILFDNSETTTKEVIPNNLLIILQIIYELEPENAKIGFRIIFEAFFSRHKNQDLLIYNLFVVVLHILGFSINAKFNINLPPANDSNYDFEKSVSILAEFIEVVSIENVTIDTKINKIKFTSCIRSIIKSILRLEVRLSESTLKILKSAINVDPMIISKSITEILIHVLLSKRNVEVQPYYEVFMIRLLEMYLKLHRIEIFISKLLVSVKDALYGKMPVESPEIEFQCDVSGKKEMEIIDDVQEIFPKNLLQYFHQCVTLQTNEQALEIMKILIKALDEAVSDLNTTKFDMNQMLYVQINSVFLCEFLLSVRIVEHTTSEILVNKFLKDMNDLKGILKRFGNALLHKEHNHILMYSFLNICYIWADLAILFTYYSPVENINFKNVISTDCSASDLTYFHNYLTTNQWSVIAQRIKNFGEQPCKQLLQKLIIQKFRAVFLFEPKQHEALETTIVKNFTSDLETNWGIVVEEKFLASTVVSKIQTSQIVALAELLLNDVIKTGNFNILQQGAITDYRDFVLAIFYVCLSNINNLFTKKRKHDDLMHLSKTLCRKILQTIDLDLFIRNETVDFTGIIELFNSTQTSHNFVLDEERFSLFLEIIKHLPICFLSENIQMTLFLYLLSICIDLKNNRHVNSKCVEKCEQFLMGLVETSTSLNIFKYMTADVLIKLIVENTTKYKDIVSLAISKGLKHDDTVTSFLSFIKFLEKNLNDDKYINIAVIAIPLINKSKTNALTDTSKARLKNYNKTLCQYLVPIVLNEESTAQKIEAYALILHHYMLTDNLVQIEQLLPKLQYYFVFITNNLETLNVESVLLLLKVILKFSSNIHILPTTIFIDIWKICERLQTESEAQNKNLCATIVLLLSRIHNKTCARLFKNFINTAINNLQVGKVDDFKKCVKIWEHLLTAETGGHSSLFSLLQLFLEQITVYIINHNNFEINEAAVKIQISIIQNKQIRQTSNLMNIYFLTTQSIIRKTYREKKFPDVFNLSFSIMEMLINNHKILLVDRLPVYHQNLRIILKQLCLNSNADKKLEQNEIADLAQCGFRAMKLVTSICSMEKNVTRIAPYLIADILRFYEEIPVYTEVKEHLNTCLYELINVCNEHGITYLLGALSTASAEIFKFTYRNFEKYYKFHGKI